MRIGSAMFMVLMWAGVEFKRRNGRPIPLVENVMRDGWQHGPGDGSDYDSFLRAEADALAGAAKWYCDRVVAGTATGDPAPTVFRNVPSSAASRQKGEASHAEWRALPWWRKFFQSDPAASRPANVTINILDIQAIRDINNQLRAQSDDAPVFTGPVNTWADLDQLVAQAAPVTQDQVSRRQGLGMTVSGGGGFGNGWREQIGRQAWDMSMGAEQMQSLSPQQALEVALLQRNYLVRTGGSKSLIRHWNEEIAQMNEVLRRSP